MVFDARFLTNPYYDPALSAMTGLDAPVAEYVARDPDYQEFLDRMVGLLELVLPRFVREGKKYATIAIGCSGGRHRSVTLVEAMALRLARQAGGTHHEAWPVVIMHRELARQGRSSWRWASRPRGQATTTEQTPRK